MEQLEAAGEEPQATGKALADVVVDLGLITRERLLGLVATHLDSEYLEQPPPSLPGDIISLVPPEQARTTAGVRALDRLRLQVPVLGDLMRKAAIARFTRTFGTLRASGVPMLQALTITRDTSGNVHIATAIDLVLEWVRAGDNVAAPLRATGVFLDMVPSMIEVGEETGALPDMLLRIADGYDEEVDNAVTALTSVLEPLMIVVMAVVVGTIVIALFLPIIRIVQLLS
jgi:type IV pilus assembly protein PilC